MGLHHSISGGRTSDSKVKRAGPPEPSCVSVKSDQSMEDPRNFSSGEGEPSFVSMKSDWSMGNPRKGEPSCLPKSDQAMEKPPVFSRGGGEPSSVSMKSDWSMGNPPKFSNGEGEPSCVSMKSDQSMGDPPVFSRGGGEPSWVSVKSDRSMRNSINFIRGEGEPSCVSMKSDWSMGNPIHFSRGGGEPSCVSVKSDWSMGNPIHFSRGGGEPSCVSVKSDRSMSNPINFSRGGGEPSSVSMKSDQSMGDPPVFSRGGGEPSWVSVKSDRSMRNSINFSRGEGEPSCVSMKSDRSMGNPIHFSRGGGEPSCVSVKSDRSMSNPINFSRGGGEPSSVSMKSDWSMGNPPKFSNGEGEPSCVSMKSDQSMGDPPVFSRGGGEPSWVSVKSDRSMRNSINFIRGEGEPSCVSMKSDWSMGNPIHFSRGGGEPSCVSVKSDWSMGNPIHFSRGGGEPSCVSVKSDRSMSNPINFSRGGGEPSSVSIKSDQSMGDPPVFSRGGGEPSWVSVKSDRSMRNSINFSRGEGEPSCVSMKSDRSMGNPIHFSRGGGEPSCVSVKSDRSMSNPINFSRGGGEPSSVSMKSDQSMGDPPVFSRGGGEPSCVSVKSDRSMSNPINFSRGGGEPSCVSMKSDRSMMLPAQSSGGRGTSDSGQHSTQTALQINTLADIYQPVDDVLHRVLERHKTSMKNKYEILFEGIITEENKTLLNRIYTQLYIIEGESEGVNEEHEVLQMEKTSRRRLHNSPINCLDIFKPLQGPQGEKLEENIRAVEADSLRHKERKEDNRPKEPEFRSVLTKGIAGIGKTVSVRKFILDWAERKANQDVELMFVLPFRELNLIKDDQYSLHGLLCDFHPELKDLDPEIYDRLKAVFIFDGLDESRIPLNFEQCEKVSDITMTSSVGVLMTNLIKGELLPSALIWITSRPAAANQIPPKYIKRVTEIQGFSDPQKEEYFRKRISDEDQAKRIISHIKTARSLHIMCHIPVFCWISATVLQQIMEQRHTEIPKTLTEMYSHFLITQTNMKNEKYEENDERDPKNLLESNRTIILKLAELAFKQLMKGNVMFYEENLRESSIDVTKASVYSGIFTEIFREECVLYQRKVYCFVHLSFQEFLAAVYVFHCYESKNMEELQIFNPLNSEWSNNILVRFFNKQKKWSEDVPLDEVLKGAVNKAVESENGHLDLFLRFLLGISLESNQRRLQGLLTPTKGSSERTRQHIKRLIKGDYDSNANKDDDDYDYKQYPFSTERSIISTERSINLFLCLSEMNDESLSREIQEYLNMERHSGLKLSPGQCSALACMLLTSEEVLDELDLKKYNTSEEGYRRLIPALTVCRKARLARCSLTTNSCENLSSALQSVNSSLKELDLSNNDLQDSGMELLSAGLKNSHCKLETLRLARCGLTTSSLENLSSALQSVNSSLKELDLSNNDLQDSGVELLSAGLKNSHCKLEIIRIDRCGLTTNSCENLSSALQSVNSSLKELNLSNNDLQDSGVELLSAGLKNLHCKLEILRLSGCMVTDEGCSFLASALKSNPSHLRELDLTYNHPGKSGLRLLSDLLENPHCKLEKIQVYHGGKIRIKPGLKKYAVTLTLDPNTVSSHLSLSERNRKVEFVREVQSYPDHPDRFDHWPQVLSVESLTGRCYWEVQWSGFVYISVSYRGIRRKGGSSDCVFGNSKHSWSLNCSSNSYSVYHNNQITVLPSPPSPSNRVGVYLDWGSGTLSFYTISPNTHTLTHLHTLTTTFTEPLYAGFWVYDSSVSLCERE
ncbi:NACHT, LRR and PYD domains-containing protein 5-like [Colossoma macropomum]|uniref:NACHT, LRR and PYD domains-containing protein 5-like n=1 Tax=Colossoma macropomum TaxID=42526 RepID=UPI001864A7A0|nr:NACHT, LRR and PYD domains-containing protein 5-like [Colossoma macropomum]